jgi:hypothetical protein
MGLRLMCKDIHSMGSSALKSRDKWGYRVHLWRKREAYIALARYLREDTPYRKWNCWLYHHYLERIKYGDTYESRHSHLFEARHFNNLLPDPPSWQKSTAKTTRKRARDASRIVGKTIPKRFCRETGSLVPYWDGLLHLSKDICNVAMIIVHLSSDICVF